jgi:hypothetical protein
LNRLASLGHTIIGVEYVEQAALDFFKEHSINYTVKKVKDFKLYSVIELFFNLIFASNN